MRDFYFDQLQRLLLPPHTRLMLYLIGQGDHFFERSDGGSGDSGGIWRTLCRDIGLTPEQEERLKAALKCVATARPPCMVGVLLPLTAWRMRMCMCACVAGRSATHPSMCWRRRRWRAPRYGVVWGCVTWHGDITAGAHDTTTRAGFCCAVSKEHVRPSCGVG